MAFNVTNQMLSEIKPFFTDDISVDFDATRVHEAIKEIIAPIYTPLQAGYPVEISDDKGTVLSEDEVRDEIIKTLDVNRDAAAEDNVTSLWKASLAHYKPGLAAAEVFVAQANAVAKCINPSPSVIYIPQDLKDACLAYITDPNRSPEKLIVNAAFCMNEPCVMVHFLSKFTFQEYKDFVAQAVALLVNNISADTASKFQDFQNMSLGMIEGLILRQNDGDELDAYSFPRVLMKATLEFCQTNTNAGIIAPYLDELICPKNLVFLDVDQISKAKRANLDKAFNNVKDGIKSIYKPISLNKISKLSTAAVNRARVAAMVKNHQQMLNNVADAQKRGIYRFRKVAMTKSDLSKAIGKIVKKETNVSASENYAKTIKGSFMRPNRRQPDDPNLQGKSISMLYKPDIHIYLDTSGSISEDNYKEAILTLITLAMKMHVNLYFNSFSHIISKKALLQTRGKSVQGVYQEFQKVPKVSGGTDYQQVWEYIMRSPKRRKEISLIITDFEYWPPSRRVDYPPKLYYAPIATNPRYWAGMVKNAEEFCKNMYHIDRNIRKHILMN